MKILYLIPARGGSKGIPNKNIKLLGNKPLIHYTIDVCREVADDADICISTDSADIINTVQQKKMSVPFIRPDILSTDTATSTDVINHALGFYTAKGIKYDAVMLLQPTSPYRKKNHLSEIIQLFQDGDEMVVSVSESHANPYFSLFEECELGYLEKSKKGNFSRRQDCPKVYMYNGSIYFISSPALQNKPLHELRNVRKYIMDDIYSIDIDTPFDWLMAETILNHNPDINQ